MNRIGQATLKGLLAVSCAVGAAPLAAADIDPAIAAYILPKDIPWKKNPLNPGNEQAVLYGDPNKPGDFYIVRVKWLPGNMSRPHFHQNDRLIVVISGTWWVGTCVTHYGGKIHYDGAKDEETVIEVHGIGPAASKPAERK